MTVPQAAYTLKLNTIIEPNVRLMRVQPTNLKVTLGQILASLTSFCWISNVAPYLQNSYRVRADQTVIMLEDIIKRSIVGSLESDAGEYVVSEMSRSTIVNDLNYLDIPLGELFKEQKSGNPGFDFFSANGTLLLFGEAKFINGVNAYNSAFKQVNKFIKEKRDEADMPDLRDFVPIEALERASRGERGYIAGFSSTTISDADLISHLKDNEQFKALPKNQEIICVAVDVR